MCMQAQWSAGVPQSACWAFTTPSKEEPCEGVLCARTALDRARASECWLGARRSISMRLRRAASFGRSVAALACRATRFASATTAKQESGHVAISPPAMGAGSPPWPFVPPSAPPLRVKREGQRWMKDRCSIVHYQLETCMCCGAGPPWPARPSLRGPKHWRASAMLAII